MAIVLAIVGIVALGLLAAGLYDRRVRRRRDGLDGLDGVVDQRAVRDARRLAESDIRMRSNEQGFGQGGTLGGGYGS